MSQSCRTQRPLHVPPHNSNSAFQTIEHPLKRLDNFNQDLRNHNFLPFFKGRSIDDEEFVHLIQKTCAEIIVWERKSSSPCPFQEEIDYSFCRNSYHLVKKKLIIQNTSSKKVIQLNLSQHHCKWFKNSNVCWVRLQHPICIDPIYKLKFCKLNKGSNSNFLFRNSNV